VIAHDKGSANVIDRSRRREAAVKDSTSTAYRTSTLLALSVAGSAISWQRGQKQQWSPHNR
jgi:hypothetical protein